MPLLKHIRVWSSTLVKQGCDKDNKQGKYPAVVVTEINDQHELASVVLVLGKDEGNGEMEMGKRMVNVRRVCLPCGTVLYLFQHGA